MDRFKLMSMLVGLLWCANGCAITTQYISQASVGTTGYTIAQPGHYIVTENITFSPLATATAITITTSGVTVDLGYRYIQQGNSTAAVNGLTVTNSLMDIVIKNGTFSRFTADSVRLLNGSSAITLSNLKCLNSTARYGLLVDGGSNDSVNDIVITDCLCKGNFLGGGFFSSANKVAMHNCRFNNNFNVGLIAGNCMLWDVKKCGFNNNIVNAAPATTVAGMSTSRCDSFFLEQCQFNGNEFRRVVVGTVQGLNAQFVTGWHINNCSFNNNATTLARGTIDGALISTSTGLVIEQCNFMANRSGSSVGMMFVTGMRLVEGHGACIKNCNFIGNAINPLAPFDFASSVRGFAQSNNDAIGKSLEMSGCLASSNLSTVDNTGIGFEISGSSANIFNCRSTNNGSLDGSGAAVGFSIGSFLSGVAAANYVIYNNEAYVNRNSAGPNDEGFFDNNFLFVAGWYAGNIAFRQNRNYFTSPLVPPVLVADSNPTYTEFDARGIDNIDVR